MNAHLLGKFDKHPQFQKYLEEILTEEELVGAVAGFHIHEKVCSSVLSYCLTITLARNYQIFLCHYTHQYSRICATIRCLTWKFIDQVQTEPPVLYNADQIDSAARFVANGLEIEVFENIA